MKILFIIPPHITFKDFISPGPNQRHRLMANGKAYGNLITDMPLGPLSMSAYLKKFEPEVKTGLLDFNVQLNRLEDFRYESFCDYFEEHLACHLNGIDIAAISSLFSPSYQSTLDIARSIRKANGSALIISGGNIPSTMYNLILCAEGNQIDAICYGEGEKPLLDLVRNGRSTLESNNAWITKQKLTRIPPFVPQHDFIWDLDEIPMYDYELCGSDYFANPAFLTYGGLTNENNSVHVMTSRGCPFKCIFCASHKVHGRKMRYFSVERIKSEFLYLRNSKNVETLIFQDDHLMGDKKRAYEIINFVGEIGCKAVFQNSLALYALDRSMLEAIKRAGINQLVLSIESGSDRVLKRVMRKPLKLDIVSQVTKNCRDLGIYTYANILIGLPGETKGDISDSLSFLRGVDANWFGIFCATPLIGSEMHEICEQNGYLGKQWIGADYKTATISTNEWTSDYIQDMTYVFNLELNFVFNSDMRLGNYSLALEGFDRAIKAKHDHAFAHYYASICAYKINSIDKAVEHLKKFTRYSKLQFWRKYIDQYQDEMQKYDDIRMCLEEACVNFSLNPVRR